MKITDFLQNEGKWQKSKKGASKYMVWSLCDSKLMVTKHVFDDEKNRAPKFDFALKYTVPCCFCVPHKI